MMSTGSMSMHSDAELAYRRQRIQQDFAAINWSAEQRAARRARAAEPRAAGRLEAASRPQPAPTWVARWLRGLRTASR